MRRGALLALTPLVSVTVFVLLLEGLVRAIGPDLSLPGAGGGFRFDQMGHTRQGYHVRDPELGWRLRPSMRMSVAVDGGEPGVMTTNSWGFRGPEVDLAPPPGLIRVAFVGDSNPMGFALPDGSIYANGVSAILESSFPKSGEVDVVILAVDGYTSHQARLVLDRHLSEVAPDVVCIQVGFNDQTLAPRPDHEQDYTRPALVEGLEASHAYRWLRRQVLRARPPAPPDTLVPRVDLRSYAENLRTMIRAARDARARVLLITTPARPGAPLSVNEEQITTPEGSRWTTQQAYLDERMAAAGVDADPEAQAALLREVAERYPDWVLPPFRLAELAYASGDSLEARLLDAEWRARDAERHRLEDYMDRLREVAREMNVPVVNTQAALARAAGTTDPRALDRYWLDFVHLNVDGQKVLALAVAQEIAAIRARSGL
jgi:lysophospholipase L1-like esterase